MTKVVMGKWAIRRQTFQLRLFCPWVENIFFPLDFREVLFRRGSTAPRFDFQTSLKTQAFMKALLQGKIFPPTTFLTPTLGLEYCGIMVKNGMWCWLNKCF